MDMISLDTYSYPKVAFLFKISKPDLYTASTFQNEDLVLSTHFLSTLVNILIKLNYLELACFAHMYAVGAYLRHMPSTEQTNPTNYTLQKNTFGVQVGSNGSARQSCSYRKVFCVLGAVWTLLGGSGCVPWNSSLEDFIFHALALEGKAS